MLHRTGHNPEQRLLFLPGIASLYSVLAPCFSPVLLARLPRHLARDLLERVPLCLGHKVKDEEPGDGAHPREHGEGPGQPDGDPEDWKGLQNQDAALALEQFMGKTTSWRLTAEG